ncbi:MAG TPA: hypothetical protein VL547_10465 [Dinghuibacter sp.]|uniref:hypothetical protein n=1 Tax=Dinghuibacter sp. TaxID=2024697 RepID=UPI002D0595D6|nr:hypothetical protein [Dinghuibacter sp.]HTJ12440.1 hypothetical protein [Dinghuibacter sp.]
MKNIKGGMAGFVEWACPGGVPVCLPSTQNPASTCGIQGCQAVSTCSSALVGCGGGGGGVV